MDYGTQAQINATPVISTAQTGVSHRHGVACGCSCAAALYSCALGVLFFCLRVPGTCLGCVLVKGLKADDI